MTYRDMEYKPSTRTVDEKLLQENARLKEEIRTLKSGLNPYNKTIHIDLICPYCGLCPRHTEGNVYVIVKSWFVPLKKRWFSRNDPAHIKFYCGRCQVIHSMETPP